MKPLSEKELREELLNHFTGGAPSYRAANESGQAAARSLAEPILEMWLQDRKAWGEYVIGEDICTCGCNFGDGCLCVSDAKLRAEQRKRNQ